MIRAKMTGCGSSVHHADLSIAETFTGFPSGCFSFRTSNVHRLSGSIHICVDRLINCHRVTSLLFCDQAKGCSNFALHHQFGKRSGQLFLRSFVLCRVLQLLLDCLPFLQQVNQFAFLAKLHASFDAWDMLLCLQGSMGFCRMRDGRTMAAMIATDSNVVTSV